MKLFFIVIIYPTLLFTHSLEWDVFKVHLAKARFEKIKVILLKHWIRFLFTLYIFRNFHFTFLNERESSLILVGIWLRYTRDLGLGLVDKMKFELLHTWKENGNIWSMIKHFPDWIMLPAFRENPESCYILIPYNLTSDTFYNSY